MGSIPGEDDGIIFRKGGEPYPLFVVEHSDSFFIQLSMVRARHAKSNQLVKSFRTRRDAFAQVSVGAYIDACCLSVSISFSAKQILITSNTLTCNYKST